MALADQCRMNVIGLARPGCGNGGLRWDVVKSLIEPLLDDRVTIVYSDVVAGQERR